MKLRRLQIESFKRFRQPIEISEFSDGLNLFAAPNEAGKSTVAEAIRAAFFERHRSSSVEHLRPWDDSAATPTVRIDFEIDGRPYRLTKVFLGKKRCELIADGHSLDGAAAEDHLAGLLGFRFASKGANSPEHLGIPGLLWIRQGSSHELADSVRYASEHLRQALSESFGELSSSSGDKLIEQVSNLRHALLTPKEASPRAEYKNALDKRAALSEALATLNASIAHYRTDVDRLDSLRHEHQRDEAEPPWRALRADLHLAEQRLDDARGLSKRRDDAADAVRQSDAHVDLLRAQQADLELDLRSLEARRERLARAESAAVQAQQRLDAWLPRLSQAVDDEARARAGLQAARQHARRVDHHRQIEALHAHQQAQQSTLRAAIETRERLLDSERRAQTLQIEPKTLARIRQLADSLRTAQMRLDAVATTLRFTLKPGAVVSIDGQSLSAHDASPIASARMSGSDDDNDRTITRTVVTRTDVDLPDIGRLTILPGGQDLDTLIDSCDTLRDELHLLLNQLGLADPAAVDAQARDHESAQADVTSGRKLLNSLAPEGIDAISARIDAGQAQINALQESTLLSVDDASPQESAAVPTNAAVDLADAESREVQAREALDATRAHVNEARLALATTRADIDSARQELSAAQARLDDPQRQSRQQAMQTQWLSAIATQAALTRQLTQLDQQLANANIALLEQDVKRWRDSIAQLETAHQQRRAELTRLEIELDTKGARGLEEEAALQRREHDQADRRCEQLARRARALDLLLTRLLDQRRQLAQRLRAPLQRHVDHYLEILFPGARIDIGDDLAPGSVTRDGPHGVESGAFESLSIGTREQMGVIARLAYADLLREAGKPTLLILDDALVHTDEQRRAQMKRVLYNAATRHQILLMTCHPAAWRDLGVPMRSLS